LEQVDKLLVESTPRTSKNWVPTTTFAAEMAGAEKTDLKTEEGGQVAANDSEV
jgi:MFS transporter, SP family, sugar:H+ symporter